MYKKEHVCINSGISSVTVQLHVSEFNGRVYLSGSQTHRDTDEKAAAPAFLCAHRFRSPYRHPHTSCLSNSGSTPRIHTFVHKRDIFIHSMKKDVSGGLTANDWRKLSVSVEMCFCRTRAYLCASDKKMFTAAADLLPCLFEVSIYSAASVSGDSVKPVKCQTSPGAIDSLLLFSLFFPRK